MSWSEATKAATIPTRQPGFHRPVLVLGRHPLGRVGAGRIAEVLLDVVPHVPCHLETCRVDLALATTRGSATLSLATLSLTTLGDETESVDSRPEVVILQGPTV